MRPLPAGELLRPTSLAHRPFVGPTGARPRTIKAASLASHQDAYDEMGMRETRRRARRSYGGLSFFDIVRGKRMDVFLCVLVCSAAVLCLQIPT